jgi:hypothetical protein
MTLPRCCYCKRIIWPWQRIGWLVGDRRTTYWHGGCR